jgi:hypothetical protein
MLQTQIEIESMLYIITTLFKLGYIKLRLTSFLAFLEVVFNVRLKLIYFLWICRYDAERDRLAGLVSRIVSQDR